MNFAIYYITFRYICSFLCFAVCSIQGTDLVLVLDLSGSTQEHYEIVTSFALTLVQGLDLAFGRSRVGIITFSTESRNEFFLNDYQDKESILNAMRFSHYGGRTNIYAALRRLNEEQLTAANGDRNGVRNIAVLVSDGYANEQASLTLDEAARIKARGTEIYTVAIGGSPNLSDINEISSDPDSDFVIRLRTLQDAEQAASDFLDILCR